MTDRPPVSGEPTCAHCGLSRADCAEYEPEHDFTAVCGFQQGEWACNLSKGHHGMHNRHRPYRPSVSGEPTWECGASDGERPGYICGRPAGHKGMHRRRAEASTGAALDRDHVAETLHMMAKHPLGGACFPCRIDAEVFMAEYARLAEQKG